MGPGMMTRKFKLTLIFLLFFSSGIFAATTQSEWVIAAQKFSFTKNKTGTVEDGMAVMFPSRILEKLSSNMYRNIKKEETKERELYKLRQEINSLFLQLSSEVKKRDSLVLEKYSQSELNRKLADADKKVEEIKKKLSYNLNAQSALTEIDWDNGKYFSSNISQNQESEKITLYKNDISALYKPSEKTAELGINSFEFTKEIVNAKINCLITGQITAYDEYIALTVQTYVFPGAKLVSTITEIGNLDDTELMALNVARQLAPVITNSIPVSIKINVVEPKDSSTFKTYIDDVLYSSIEDAFIIDSGVHNIQFIADGYKSAGTNYYFEGNKFYDIKVELCPLEEKTIYIRSRIPKPGEYVINGNEAQLLSDNTAKIIINDNPVLGQFISEDNASAFFYIPQNQLFDNVLYTAKLNPLDHSDYIEKRRRRMYLSYSVLVTSLVPAIITQGRLSSYVKLLNDPTQVNILQSQGKYDEVYKDARAWNTSAIICTGVSVAAGVWFVYELYRYFSAANSVLPEKTKIDFDYMEPEPEINSME